MLKKKCKMCKTDYLIDEDTFNGAFQKDESGVSVGCSNEQVRFCSEYCFQRHTKAKHSERPKGVHKSDWDPIR